MRCRARLLGVLGAKRLGAEEDELAADARARRLPDLEVDVARLGGDRLAEELDEVRLVRVDARICAARSRSRPSLSRDPTGSTRLRVSCASTSVGIVAPASTQPRSASMRSARTAPTRRARRRVAGPVASGEQRVAALAAARRRPRDRSSDAGARRARARARARACASSSSVPRARPRRGTGAPRSPRA